MCRVVDHDQLSRNEREMADRIGPDLMSLKNKTGAKNDSRLRRSHREIEK